MEKKVVHSCFPFVVMFYILMIVSYGISASSVVITRFNPSWNFVPISSIPYDVIGWFWMAIASIYVGGTALLNLFTSRNLQDLSRVSISSEKLLKVSYMNYFACLYCFLIVLIGVDIPLEAIISSAGACTILAVAGKKAAGTAVQHEMYSDDEMLLDLEKKLYERRISGEFVDSNGSGRDDVLEELRKKIRERRDQIDRENKESVSIKSEREIPTKEEE